MTCDPPPPIFHGSFHCSDGFRFDSVCRLNCSDPAGNTAAAVTGGSAHTVRLLHPPCKQVCPSLSSLSDLTLPVVFVSLPSNVKNVDILSFFLSSSHPYVCNLGSTCFGGMEVEMMEIRQFVIVQFMIRP